MATYPYLPHSSTAPVLRMSLFDAAPVTGPEGAWWPRSRRLQAEARRLVDQFPTGFGHINQLLFSRLDWDDGVIDIGGLRRIYADRGPVPTASSPGDAGLMTLSMTNGRHLRLRVIPCDTDRESALGMLRGR